MSQPGRLTRREALGTAAAVGAASLAAPAAGSAAVRPRRRWLSSRWVGQLAGTSAPVAAPRRFSLVGVQWTATAAPRIELRTRRRDGGWSPWAIASALGHEPDAGGNRHSRFGQPVWSGPADYVQLRTDVPVSAVEIHFVSARAATHGARAAGGYPLAAPVLAAGPGQPPIIARVAWAQGHAPPAVTPGYGAVKLAFVHHSETPNGYSSGDVPAMLMSIYDYHRFVQQWNDIGYNFAVDAFGRIWEAREGGIDQAVIGAQAGGYNAVSTGAVVLGSFTSVSPSDAAVNALEHLLAWKLSLHGVPSQGRVTVRVNPSAAFYTPFAPGQHVSLPRVAGHRDGDSTNCPGDALYALLPDIRSRIGALAGKPARLTLDASPTTLVAGAPIKLSGRLATLTGTPLKGATIEIQRVAPANTVTLVQARTAADGAWSAELSLSENVVLGALHRSRPSAVAPSAVLAVSPQLTLNVASQTPLRVSGTVYPVKKHVKVELYALSGKQPRLVHGVRAAAAGGRFAATLRRPRPGRYVVHAVTAADARNAAGRSPDVTLTL